MKRLTDEELSAVYWNGLANDGPVEKWLDLERSLAMATELRARREQDLTRDELDALRGFVDDCSQDYAAGDGPYPSQAVVAAIEKLLKGADRGE